MEHQWSSEKWKPLSYTAALVFLPWKLNFWAAEPLQQPRSPGLQSNQKIVRRWVNIKNTRVRWTRNSGAFQMYRMIFVCRAACAVSTFQQGLYQSNASDNEVRQYCKYALSCIAVARMHYLQGAYWIWAASKIAFSVLQRLRCWWGISWRAIIRLWQDYNHELWGEVGKALAKLTWYLQSRFQGPLSFIRLVQPYKDNRHMNLGFPVFWLQLQDCLVCRQGFFVLSLFSFDISDIEPSLQCLDLCNAAPQTRRWEGDQMEFSFE